MDEWKSSTATLRRSKPGRKQYLTMEKHPISVILDGVHSNVNIGAILRLAEAFLLEKVYLCGPLPNLSTKRIKATSRGAEKWIATEQLPDTLTACTRLKAQGYQLVAVELSRHSTSYLQLCYQPKVAFVLGDETAGVDDHILQRVDAIAEIPLFGMANSLNVSSAASIVLADAVQKIRYSLMQTDTRLHHNP